MANKLSNHFFYHLALKTIDFSADLFKICLMESGFIFDPDTHHKYSDISGDELPNGNGYVSGGETLDNRVITEDDTNNRITITWDNPSWTASGGDIGPTPCAIIYDDTHADKLIVGALIFPIEYKQVDGGVASLANVMVWIGKVPTT